MRDASLDPVAGLLQRDQPAHVGLLDRLDGGDPLQDRQFQRLGHGERVHHIADRGTQIAEPRLDEFDQAGRQHRPAHPLPAAVVLLQPAVGQFLFDDVAQVEGVAAGQLPEPVGGVGVDGSLQRRAEQLGAFLLPQRPQVQPVEGVVLPDLTDAVGDRVTVAHRQDHPGRAALHDLVQHERRQVIEQLGVIDDEERRTAGRGGGDRVDHPAHQLQTVAVEMVGPGGERAQRQTARRGRPDDPVRVRAGQGLPDDPALADTGDPGHHDPAQPRGRHRRSQGVDLCRPPHERPTHAHVQRVGAGATVRRPNAEF